MYQLKVPFPPAGDQPQAIKSLIQGIEQGLQYQTLLGVTGSGKTYTMANVIAQTNRPALILAPNKTLAAQLYSEFRDFFPNNAVEYFVSYYDYYQPEAYVAQRDVFIEKDSAINEQIEQLRLSATKSLLERKDTIIVATVSAIYGIGNPEDYHKMVLVMKVGDILSQRDAIMRLIRMQYQRNDFEFSRGIFRVRGDVLDIFPSEHADCAIRVEIDPIDDDKIVSIKTFDPLTGEVFNKINMFALYPSSHYVSPRETVLQALETIKAELRERKEFFLQENKLVEAQRIEQRTQFDLEMLYEIGFCKGIENYSSHLSKTPDGEAPPTLLDYLPNDALIFLDESHVMVGQLGAMYHGDRSRKTTLVEYGFRLPSALNNRPLCWEEVQTKLRQCIFVSATPADKESELSQQTVEQIVRPTGLIDPIVEVRSANTQVDDVIQEIRLNVERNERTIITVLTKRMAEELADYLEEQNIRARYMHSDIDTIERVEILRDLRLGVFDVLIGINLLREGIDIPELSLMAIFDADKEGFLRSKRSLIQMIGRSARHLTGKTILYAERITDSMQYAIDETLRRRQLQIIFNEKNNITPTGIKKGVKEIIEGIFDGRESQKTQDKNANNKNMLQKGSVLIDNEVVYVNTAALEKEIKKQEKLMKDAARDLNFESATQYRNSIRKLREQLLYL